MNDETDDQVSPKIDDAAKRCFAAYNERAGGLTWDGKPIPPWEEITPKIRNRWRAGVAAILD